MSNETNRNSVNRTKRTLPGVFCLEGPWSSTLLDTSTLRPILELLDSAKVARFIYRDAVTIEEFETYIKKWSQRQYRNYAFGYMAFHGSPGVIDIGRKSYSIEALGELMAGRLKDRVLYFGACSTLAVDRGRVEDFRHQTGARAVCGYTTDVDWIEGAAFELNLIYSVISYQRIDAGFKYLQRNHAGECARLGLRAIWKGGGIWE